MNRLRTFFEPSRGIPAILPLLFMMLAPGSLQAQIPAIERNADTYQPDWKATQTVAPENIMVSPAGASSATVTWTPILYTADTGGYEILASTTAEGPWTVVGSVVRTRPPPQERPPAFPRVRPMFRSARSRSPTR